MAALAYSRRQLLANAAIAASRARHSQGSDILDAKLVGPPREEFVELRLGGPDNLVLQHFYQPVN